VYARNDLDVKSDERGGESDDSGGSEAMAIMQEASFDHHKPRIVGTGETTTESSRQAQLLPEQGQWHMCCISGVLGKDTQVDVPFYFFRQPPKLVLGS